MIDRGEIRDAKTVAGLLAYDRIRPRQAERRLSHIFEPRRQRFCER